MQYPATITQEGKKALAQFPDCPGCQTEADPGEDIYAQAKDALTGWLEAHLVAGEVPPRPPKRRRAPRGAKLVWVRVPAKLAMTLSLRWARQDAGISQAELAHEVGVTQQQIAKLEHPDANPTVNTLEKVAAALGVELEVAIIATHAKLKRQTRHEVHSSH